MEGLQQQQIIASGSRGNRSRFGSTTPPPAAHISYSPELVGKQYGWVKIISSEKRWGKNWNHCLVLTECTGCRSVQWTYLDNLTRGKSKGCQSCSQPRRIPRWLDRRLTAAKQRCTNPKDQGYPNYGRRGIEFRFSSVTDAGLWVLHNLENVSQEMEMDRIDNEGHYEPGNLRLVPRRVNQMNRRQTVLPEWEPTEWPYSRVVVTRKLSEGMTREQILEEAQLAVKQKRKNWRGIKAKLESMTSLTADRGTDSQ